MAYRNFIARDLGESFEVVYLHYGSTDEDGKIGEVLRDHRSDPKKIDLLFKTGDLSFLGEERSDYDFDEGDRFEVMDEGKKSIFYKHRKSEKGNTKSRKYKKENGIFDKIREDYGATRGRLYTGGEWF